MMFAYPSISSTHKYLTLYEKLVLLQVNGTLEWFQAHCEALGLELEQEIERDVEYAEQSPEV